MKRNTTLALLVVVILIGFALRLYRLDAVAFRGDEAFSVQYWSGQTLAQTFEEIATIEPHPPLTYVIFRAWGVLVGNQSEFALRLLSVLSNTIGIAGMYAFGKRLSSDRRVGVLSAGLWTIHAFQIWHAQDFRNYGLWAGLSILTLWSALRVMHLRQMRDWILFCGIALVTGYIFYMELVTIGVIGLYVLARYWRDWRFVLNWSVVNGVIIALVFVAFFMTQGDLVGSGTYGGTTGGLDLSQYGYRFIPVLNFGDTLSFEFRQSIWLIMAVLFAVSWVVVLWRNREQALYLALLIIVPLIMIGLISTQLHIFRPRYIMMSSPAYVVLITTALFTSVAEAKTNPKFRAILGFTVCVIVGWVVISGLSLRNYYTNPAYQKAPDWVALTDYLHDHTQAGEVVVQTAVDSAYGFYYDAPADDFALPRSPDQPRDEIIANLEAWSNEYDSVWVVARTLDWPNAGIVEAWAEENLQLVRDTETGTLPIREYKRWDVSETEISDDVLATFDDSIQLLGSRILPIEPTGEIPIWLYWKPQSRTEESLTVFVHLIGDMNPETGSPLWSQDDHPPQNGRATTDLWITDEVYRDVYELDVTGIPAGNYAISVGLYNPNDGRRMLTETGDDSYQLAIIAIP